MCFSVGCIGEALIGSWITVMPCAFAFRFSNTWTTGKKRNFTMYLMPLDSRNSKSASFFGFDPLYTPSSSCSKRTNVVPGAGCSRLMSVVLGWPADCGALGHAARTVVNSRKVKIFIRSAALTDFGEARQYISIFDYGS